MKWISLLRHNGLLYLTSGLAVAALTAYIVKPFETPQASVVLTSVQPAKVSLPQPAPVSNSHLAADARSQPAIAPQLQAVEARLSEARVAARQNSADPAGLDQLVSRSDQLIAETNQLLGINADTERPALPPSEASLQLGALNERISSLQQKLQ